MANRRAPTMCSPIRTLGCLCRTLTDCLHHVQRSVYAKQSIVCFDASFALELCLSLDDYFRFTYRCTQSAWVGHAAMDYTAASNGVTGLKEPSFQSYLE